MADRKAFSQFGGGNRHFTTPASRLADEVRGLDDVVIVGTKNGQPWIGSSVDETRAQDMLEQAVPQEA